MPYNSPAYPDYPAQDFLPAEEPYFGGPYPAADSLPEDPGAVNDDDFLTAMEADFLRTAPPLSGQGNGALSEAPAEELPLSLEGAALLADITQLAEEAAAVEDDGLPDIPYPLPPLPNPQKVKRIRIAVAAVFSAAIVFSLLSAGVTLLNRTAAKGLGGLRFFIEPTAAMAPAVPRGALLITKTKQPEQINTGDIIKFSLMEGSSSALLTREVAERVDPADGNGVPVFRTRRGTDAPIDAITVNQTRILGVKIAVLPGLGSVISFLQAYAGAFATLAAILCLAAVQLRMLMQRPKLAGFRLWRKKTA
ncbi:MAG: hypothetical protein LBJ11_09395 [Oscillospiraceae bacterium]|nr:hypothetical protein [Oscillospiraceae bacterium]